MTFSHPMTWIPAHRHRRWLIVFSVASLIVMAGLQAIDAGLKFTIIALGLIYVLVGLPLSYIVIKTRS